MPTFFKSVKCDKYQSRRCRRSVQFDLPYQYERNCVPHGNQIVNMLNRYFKFMWITGSQGQKVDNKKKKNTIPLEIHIGLARAKFARERQEIPKLRAKCDELRKIADGFTQRYQYRQKLDMYCEINEIQTEIDNRQSTVREQEFEHMITPYMNAYTQRVEINDPTTGTPRNITVPGCGRKRETIDSYVQQYDATAIRQTTLINEYLVETQDEPPKLAINTRDVCPLCKEVLMLVNAKAIMTCSSCGYSVTYLDATMQSMSYNDDVEFSSFSYVQFTPLPKAFSYVFDMNSVVRAETNQSFQRVAPTGAS